MKLNLKQLLADLVSLKHPTTAAAFVLFIVTLISPFGIVISVTAATAIILGVGTVAAFVQTLVVPK